MAELASLHAIVYGRVQGVFFRDFVAQHAQALGLAGYVRNLPQGSVEVYVEGSRPELESLLGQLRKGPPGARVDQVEAHWTEYEGRHLRFEIRF